MKVLINQIGYELTPGFESARCRALVQSTTGEDLPDSLTLRDEEGRRLEVFPAAETQVVEGWKNRIYRVVDCVVPEGGPYTLEAASGAVLAVSPPFMVGTDIEATSLLSDILFGINAGRSQGVSDRQDRYVPFFGDRDGYVDVHGGWYDASGDTSKYLSHLSYANYMNPQQTPLVVWCLLDAFEYLESSRFRLEERLILRFLEEAVWGADFLIRMADPDGYFYMTVFDIWSKDLDERRICAYKTQHGILTDEYQAAYRQGGGMAIAALARSASLLKAAGRKMGDFDPDAYYDTALAAWRHLEKHNLRYLDNGKENILDDTCALLAAVELLNAGAETDATEDLRKAIGFRSQRLIDRWNTSGGYFRADDGGEWSWFHASDESLPIIALLRAVETGVLDSRLAVSAERIAGEALAAEIERASEVSNPFLHPRHLVSMPGLEDRTQFFYPHENPSGYWWQGENARLASWAAAGRRVLHGGFSFSKTNDAVSDFADAQISWILGRNPFDACMLQGQGRNNPPYEWDHFNVPGGVANGVTSGFEDEDDIAFMPEEVMSIGDHSWRWGEQWIPHAAWLLLAVAWSVPPGGPGSE